MKKNNDRPVLSVVLATGIATLAAQLLMVRECIAQFSGNEFVITLILFSWLLLGGIGNRLARLLNKIMPATKIRLAWISLILSAAPVFCLYAFRYLRDVVFIHGSNVGFYPTLTFIFLCMAPYGLLVGAALPYGLFVLKRHHPDYPGTTIYLTDNLGNVIGGILFSFVLIFFTTPFQCLMIVGMLLLLSVCFLIRSLSSNKGPTVFFVLFVFTFLIGSLLFEKDSLTQTEGKLVFYKESRFGRITIIQNREQYTLFEDGDPAVFSQNISLAEESVHYPLSQISHAKQMLLISTHSGMMAEIEKYHPDLIDYVELNPDISSVLFKYGFIQSLNGINIINQDGRAYLSRTQKVYDAIIVNLPDPTTFQVNRFFTDHFFSLVKQHLAADGVFSFSTPGYDNYLSEPLRQKLSSLYNTASVLFNNVTLLPGNNVYFLCRNQPVHLNIPERLAEKGISTLYISRFFRGNMTPERIRQLNQAIDPSTRKNEDLSPQLMQIMFREWFSLHQTSPKGFIIGVTVFGIIYLLIMSRVEYVLSSTGFVTMGSEILTIFAVQICFGYIYSQIGLIVTVFLAGLFPGAWLGVKWNGDKKTLLMILDALLMVLLVLFSQMAETQKGAPSLMFFILFGFAVSLACGCQFPLALNLLKDTESGAVKSFSADLIGAAFGVLSTSLLLIPFFGIIGATWALIGLKCISLVQLLFARPASDISNGGPYS